MKRSKQEKENRKEDIFEAAVACFNEYGYYRTSMDLIAARANMTKSGLYYHFKAKDELFIQIFHYMNDKYYAQIPKSAVSIDDPEQRLQMYVGIARQMLAQNEDFLKFSHEFMAIGMRKPEIRKVMTSYYREQVDRLQNTIQKGIAAGTFVNVDPQKMARDIVLTTLGAFTFYFSLDADFDLADQHSFDITHIIRGLKNFNEDAE
ncbi:MAG: TetR/AcrR family transcriptional regulator [Deltaproteobacteria bacterium]|nr:TetR/AcrR family transcriptional regulator [Deltaproteobacteria bacterium]